MKNVKFASLLKVLILCCSVSFLFACGTGGGTTSTSEVSGLGPGGGGTTVDPGNGSATIVIAKTALQAAETTTVTATFRNADGTPAAGINLLFSTTLGTITPAGGTVSTGANGTATVSLTAGTTSGQGQVTVSGTVNNKSITTSGLFSVSLPVLSLVNMTLISNPSGAIDYGSTQGISVEVRDAVGNLYTAQPVDVTFTSTQVGLKKSTISSPVTSVNGVATTTYTAVTAQGSDTVSASISGASANISMAIKPLTASSITFVSAEPTNIGLKGMGGLGIQEQSRVTFKVLDSSGGPKANQPVTFDLSTKVGGISMLGSEPAGSGNTVSASTGADGTASVFVTSGTIATPVRVIAKTTIIDSVGNSVVVTTQSDQLVISTGIPAQDGFSISLGDMNPECWNIDGVRVPIIARLSDHFHNLVPDGTAIYFTPSGGAIESSCTTGSVGIDPCPTTAEKGACCVVWRSQNPRPIKPGSPTGLPSTGALKDGRAVILAYAVGEEYFLDLNGNGLADATDTWIDDSEAFRDDNEDSVRQASEASIDFNSNGAFDILDGQYNGVLQGPAYANAPKTKHTFSNSVVVMATSGAKISDSCGGAIAIASGGSETCTIYVSDLNDNTMPSGTKVEFALSDVQSCTGGATPTCSFGIITPTKAIIVPQNVAFYNHALSPLPGMPIDVTIANKSIAASTGRANLIVTVTSPKGLVTTTSYPIN